MVRLAHRSPGFSNDVLWPLFHYMPLPIYQSEPTDKVTHSFISIQGHTLPHTRHFNETTAMHFNTPTQRFDTELWEAYREANVKCVACCACFESTCIHTLLSPLASSPTDPLFPLPFLLPLQPRFADAVAEVMQEDSDYVWVHDYHLMCVAASPLYRILPSIQSHIRSSPPLPLTRPSQTTPTPQVAPLRAAAALQARQHRLVPPHALPLLGDLPHPPRAQGPPRGSPRRRPTRCATLRVFACLLSAPLPALPSCSS